ncbi:transketolase [Streptomyces sp. ITFR-6]|uniref:transketolase n=1 Tax=Streptomyces sp. ITFR-6 TaxID=3075197 RepID=UPI0028893090|nr:transketolase [Streptomyces sp. ITFR-6]WNI32326.1 transketolase [Streptomyces sp. ITFR-6]
MTRRLAELAHRLRRDIVRMAAGPQGAHLGGSLSCADILAVLYGEVLDERDAFILSKGHAAPALYAALAATGRLGPEELTRYATPGSRLFGHPPRGLPGVEFPTGSLGHGLSLASGLALAERFSGGSGRVYLLLGDGELQEGTVWEAAMFAGHQRLNNIVAVIDRNRLQITGPTEDRVGLEPLAARFEAFGWETRTVDGHDLEALRTALRRPGERPVAVIARTLKGRGVSFLQGKTASHYVTLRPELLKRAYASLEAQAPS